ncbi:MAG: discoidin domain-containing protein, partial [Opitutaceae bacterium]|nr:discoidin domain-containing protein [Opitutaceae bacterium]
MTSRVHLALGAALFAPTLLIAQPRLIDAFDSTSAWTAVPSEGASATIALADGQTGRALALEFELTRTYSYAIARCDLVTPLELPEDFRFTFDLRAETAVNNFEFKLVDEHDNVWWQRRLDFAYPRDWTRQSIRRRHLTLAWGPQPQAPLRRVKSIELVISAGNGGRGRLLVDNLRFEGFDARVAAAAQARVSVSSAAPGGEPSCDRAGNLTKPWRFAPGDTAPQLTLDFGVSREIGGVMLEWAAGAFAAAYDVQLSDDGVAWTTVGTVTAGNGGRDWLYLPDQQGRALRLVLDPGV